jgi:paraquat-inducible protein A
MARDAITQCHECGLLQRIPVLPVGAVARCPRCGCRLHSQRPDSLEPALALTLAGVVLFAVANSLPFLSFQMQGQTTETTLATGVLDLYAAGRWELAAVVGFTSILAPGLQLALLLAVLVPLKLGRLPAGVARLFRYSRTLAPWGMMDVFMLGILVAVVKLSDMATLVPGTSLFAFVVLIFVLAAAQAALDPDVVWSEVPLPEGARRPPDPGEAVYGCPACELVVPTGAATGALHPSCPRCGESLHLRKPRSLQRTWALVVAAVLLYIPANLYPVMAVTSLGRTQADTILSGVVYLLNHGMWPLALVVFVVYHVVGMRSMGVGNYFKHMVPAGLPKAIVPLIFFLELVTYFFTRPVTLALRLFGNMFAGHILLLLCALGGEHLLFGDTGLGLKATGVLVYAGGFVMTLFEGFVEFLQAYVFTLLSALYIAGSLADEH